LVGIEMIDKGIPRNGYVIGDANGHPIGHITSGTQSPSLGKAIGLGYVKPEFAAIDTLITVQVRDKHLQARVSKIPFQ
jgi:aminomethyltransferase